MYVMSYDWALDLSWPILEAVVDLYFWIRKWCFHKFYSSELSQCQQPVMLAVVCCTATQHTYQCHHDSYNLAELPFNSGQLLPRTWSISHKNYTYRLYIIDTHVNVEESSVTIRLHMCSYTLSILLQCYAFVAFYLYL